VNNYKIDKISGTALPLRGDSIDTDRILPARYLRTVTFEGIERYAFEDDRLSNQSHPFNLERFNRASILLVEQNFGCGSSREHAPQALKRRGFKVIVGASFGEIFFHNSVAIGLPCVRLSEENIKNLLEQVETDSNLTLEINLSELSLKFAETVLPIMINESARQQFLNGTWNSTLTLLQAGEAIEETARRLPYLNF
jgi:3-isopropylmalate/(R)-2-methylmalate dehydratase small subunit